MSHSGESQTSLPRVVIVGAGFGGLYAAQALRYAPVQVTLIDKNNYHLFQPMLYQVATGLLGAEQIASPVRGILRSQRNVEVLMDEVTGVDPARRVVQMDKIELPYDYLILATGAHYNYFGHDEWQQHAPSLKTIADATQIRGKLLEAFEAAELLSSQGGADEEKIRHLLTFVLVGAGATGVEMSGSMADMTRSLMCEYRHLSPEMVQIILVDAAPRILGAFPADMAEQTLHKLQSMGVTVRLGEEVQQIDSEGVTVKGKDGAEQRIESRTVFWTAGVIASPAGEWINAPIDKEKRIQVNPDFSVPGYPDIYAIGDTALLLNRSRDLIGRLAKDAKPLPGVAQPAMQAGEYVAKVIRRRVRHLAAPPPFHYYDKGDLAQVSRGFAVADLKIIRFTGLPAWILWLGIHIVFLIGFANRILVLIQWITTVLTDQRGMRDFNTNEGLVLKEETAAGAHG